MASLNGFNANNVDTTDTFTPMPAGQYLVAITDSEMRETKARTGSYLRLTMEVLDGDYKGRKVWDNLNLDNPSPTAVEIAEKALGQICKAVGVPTPNDSVELHGKPMLARLVVREQEGYDPSNEVKGYAAANDGAPVQVPVQAAAPQMPAAPPPPAAAGPQVSAPSWG